MIAVEKYCYLKILFIYLVRTYLIFDATISFLLAYAHRVPEISSDNKINKEQFFSHIDIPCFIYELI